MVARLNGLVQAAIELRQSAVHKNTARGTGRPFVGLKKMLARHGHAIGQLGLVGRQNVDAKSVGIGDGRK